MSTAAEDACEFDAVCFIPDEEFFAFEAVEDELGGGGGRGRSEVGASEDWAEGGGSFVEELEGDRGRVVELVDAVVAIAAGREDIKRRTGRG